MKAEIDPYPNKGLAQAMLSSNMRVAVFAVALKAAAAYRSIAPKRSGKLAASAFAGSQKSDMSGRDAKPGDRWMGVVRVYAYYGVWNQTGAGPGKHPRSTGNMPIYGPYEGSKTFSKIVAALEARQ